MTDFILPTNYDRAQIDKYLEDKDCALLASNTLSIGVAKLYRQDDDFGLNFFFRYHTNEELKEMVGGADLPTERGDFFEAVAENYHAAMNAHWTESVEAWRNRFDNFNAQPTDAERELLGNFLGVSTDKGGKYFAKAIEGSISTLQSGFQNENGLIIKKEESLNDYISKIQRADELKKMSSISEDDRIFVMQVGILERKNVDKERTYFKAVKERLQNGLYKSVILT